MSECHRTKSILKGIIRVFKTKGPQIRCIPHGSFRLSRCKSTNKKTCWLTNSKIKGPQIRCSPHGRWGLAQCKSTCEEHAGSDKSFENITLYALINYRLKFNSQRKREHWKPWFWVEKQTRYFKVNRAAKNKLVLSKIEHKTLFFKAAALNAIYKANQSTELPFQTRDGIKACSPVRSSWPDNEQLQTTSCKYKTMTSLAK